MSGFLPTEPPPPGSGLFGVDHDPDRDEVVIIGVPWEPTASYGRGTSGTPSAIVPASHQLDFFDPAGGGNFGETVGMLPVKEDWLSWNRQCIEKADKVHRGEVTGSGLENCLAEVNRISARLNRELYQEAKAWAGRGKLVGVLGGDHSSPLGAMRACFEAFPGAGLLHFDAHHDLRKAYEGFHYSHASIMFNFLQEVGPETTLVSVGIRDYSEEEYRFAANKSSIHTFYDRDLRMALFRGRSWAQSCELILEPLPEHVYISFDIDGLDPSLCPHTGTPVPGGLSFAETDFLLDALVTSGRTVIGFDLCEVSPNPHDPGDEWDLNVGARILFKLCASAHRSQKTG